MLPQRGLDTNSFQTNGFRSSFIIDTRKSPFKELKKKELRQTELKELLKDHPPSVQLQLVEAYRKGFQSSTENDKKSRMFETLTNNFGKIIIFGVVFYYLFRSSDKIIGGG